MRTATVLDPKSTVFNASTTRARGGVLLVRGHRVFGVEEDFVGVEAGSLRDEAVARSRGGVAGSAWSTHQTLLRAMSLGPMTMRWISDVPSPMSSSGASR